MSGSSPEPFDFRDLRTAKQIAAANPALSCSTLKWWIYGGEANGLQAAIIRIGRKVLIHEPTFNAWLRDRLGRPPRERASQTPNTGALGPRRRRR